MAANRGVIPPIHKLRAAGCPIALGTDNNTNDVFEVMRIALITERIDRDDPFPGVRPQPEDMLEDATLGGAQAVRQSKTDRHRSRSARRPTCSSSTRSAPISCPRAASCRRGSTTARAPTSSRSMIDGQFVMRDRQGADDGRAAIIAEADKVGRRIWGQVQKAGPVPIPGRPRK